MEKRDDRARKGKGGKRREKRDGCILIRNGKHAPDPPNLMNFF